MPHKLTPHTKEKSSTLIKVCVVEVSSSRLAQRKVLSRLWKSFSLSPHGQNVFETGLLERQHAAPMTQDTLCTWQKQWAFESRFPLAPPHLDGHLTQPPALLPTVLPTAISPAYLPYLSLHLLIAKACWSTPGRTIDVLISSLLGEGATAAQRTEYLPKDAAAVFIYTQLLSQPLVRTYIRTDLLWRHLRSSLTNLSLILLELSFCPNKAPTLSLTLAYILTLSSPNILSSEINPGVFWWPTTRLS